MVQKLSKMIVPRHYPILAALVCLLLAAYPAATVVVEARIAASGGSDSRNDSGEVDIATTSSYGASSGEATATKSDVVDDINREQHQHG